MDPIETIPGVTFNPETGETTIKPLNGPEAWNAFMGVTSVILAVLLDKAEGDMESAVMEEGLRPLNDFTEKYEQNALTAVGYATLLKQRQDGFQKKRRPKSLSDILKEMGRQ